MARARICVMTLSSNSITRATKVELDEEKQIT